MRWRIRGQIWSREIVRWLRGRSLWENRRGVIRIRPRKDAPGAMSCSSIWDRILSIKVLYADVRIISSRIEGMFHTSFSRGRHALGFLPQYLIQSVKSVKVYTHSYSKYRVDNIVLLHRAIYLDIISIDILLKLRQWLGLEVSPARRSDY